MLTEPREGPTEWKPETGWPSPDEIEALTAEIRAGWSPAVRESRFVCPEQAADVTVVAVEDIAAADDL